MAVSKNIVNNDTGSEIYRTYNWTSTGGSDHLDATTFIDVSALTDDGDGTVDRLKINKVWVTTHMSVENTTFADNAFALYLLDSNNVPIMVFDRDSGPEFDLTEFDGYDTKDFSNNANGDLKIAMGRTYRQTTGTVEPNSNVEIGGGFTITVKATKIFA